MPGRLGGGGGVLSVILGPDRKGEKRKRKKTNKVCPEPEESPRY